MRVNGRRGAFQGRRPHLPEVLFRHPFEFAFAVVLLFSGARVVLSQEALPSTLGHMPLPLEVAYRLTVITAGLLMLLALTNRRAKWASAAEQGGLWLAGTALATYAAAVLIDGTTARHTIMVGMLIALSLACAIRAKAIAREERAYRFVIREAMNGDTHE